MSARGKLSIGATALAVPFSMFLVACDNNNDPSLATAPDASLSIPDDTGVPASDDAILIPRACALASADEVAAAVGAMPASSAELDRGGTLVCSFTDEAGTEMASISIVTTGADPSPTAVFAALSEPATAEPATVEHVTGFGDDAVWVDDSLHVLIDGELVTFTLVPQPTLEGSEAIRSATMVLAEVAMPRFAPV